MHHFFFYGYGDDRGLHSFPTRRSSDLGLGKAIAAAQQATRNYAKRQVTWFHHQIARAVVYDRRYSPEMAPDIIAVTSRFLLTE